MSLDDYNAPRVDANAVWVNDEFEMVPAGFARGLEHDIAELQSLRSNDAATIKMLSDQLKDYDNRVIPNLQAQINKMKSCENCNHHHGEECTDPDLSELTHEEYYNGCEHWRLKDAT